MVATARPTIAVLGGTGAEGRGLALRWAAAGDRVIIGSRDAERARATAAWLAGRLVDVPGAVPPTGAGDLAAAQAGDVVVLSVPYAALAETLTAVRPALPGKVLVSVVVPLVPPKVATVHLPPGGSAAAEAQHQVGPDVRVVAAFHNVAAANLDDLTAEASSDVLVCGDDPDAKAVVLDLVARAGAVGYDAGPLANAVVPEGLTSILIGLNRRHKVTAAGMRITNVPRRPAGSP